MCVIMMMLMMINGADWNWNEMTRGGATVIALDFLCENWNKLLWLFLYTHKSKQVAAAACASEYCCCCCLCSSHVFLIFVCHAHFNCGCGKRVFNLLCCWFLTVKCVQRRRRRRCNEFDTWKMQWESMNYIAEESAKAHSMFSRLSQI